MFSWRFSPCARFLAWSHFLRKTGAPLFRKMLRLFTCSTRGDRGYGFQIRNDGVDLGALQVVLEGRHARRAVADDAADHLVAAAGRLLGQAGTVGARNRCALPP